MNTQHYDLISIGGGSGGLAVAERAAMLGANAAIIDPQRLGGTCVNNGCVPKKVMWYAAELAHAVDEARGFGIPARRDRTDWQTLLAGRDRYVSNINGYWDGYVRERGISHIQGYATFVDARTVEVNGEQYSADHIVLATGSQPIVPPLPGADPGHAPQNLYTGIDARSRFAVDPVMGSGQPPSKSCRIGAPVSMS